MAKGRAVSLARIGKRHLRGDVETLELVIARAVAWLRAIEAAGFAKPVLASLEGSRMGPSLAIEDLRKLLVQFDRASALVIPPPSTALAKQLAELEAQSGAPLPPSLVALWTARRESKPLRVLLDGVMMVRLSDAADYLRLPAWTAGHRLATVRLGPNSISPLYRTLGGEYVEWYAATKPKLRLPREGSDRPRASWRNLGPDHRRMLDPSFADALVQVAYNYGEWRMIVSELRDARGECPVFVSGDDFEGFAHKIGRDCGDWLGWELDAAIWEACGLEGGR